MVVTSCGTGSSTPRAVDSSVGNSTEPPALEIARAWFVAGETMEFELSLRGIVGGRAHVVVGEPGIVDDRHVIIVRSRLETTGVVALLQTVTEDVITWIDVDSGLPIYLRADHRSRGTKIVLETRFGRGAPGSFTFDIWSPGIRQRFRQAMPPRRSALDIHAMVAALRAWDGELDEQAYFYLLAVGRLWRNTIQMIGREHIRTSLGRTAAIRIDGAARELSPTLSEHSPQSVHYTIWFSDDAERRPLLVRCETEQGTARAELTRYWRSKAGVAAE